MLEGLVLLISSLMYDGFVCLTFENDFDGLRIYISLDLFDSLIVWSAEPQLPKAPSMNSEGLWGRGGSSLG